MTLYSSLRSVRLSIDMERTGSLVNVVKSLHFFLQFASISDDDLRNPLSIHFVGEVGRDDGGVTRDWYSVLSKEIFNPQYGLFTFSAADDYTFQINPNSGINPDHLDFFRFIGTIVGKALLDGCLLDAHFTRLVYKRILDKPVTYHDMATVDVQFYKSLVWVRCELLPSSFHL